MISNKYLLYQIHNIGIFIEKKETVPQAKQWEKKILKTLKTQLMGFENLLPFCPIRYELVCKNFNELTDYQSRLGTIIISNTYTFHQELFIDLEKKIGIRKRNNTLEFWSTGGKCFLLFLLQLFLFDQQKTFLHATAIAINQKCLLFPAFKGIDAIAFIAKIHKENGVTILGNDLIISNSNQIISPFPLHFKIPDQYKSLFPKHFAPYQQTNRLISSIQIIPLLLQKIYKKFSLKQTPPSSNQTLISSFDLLGNDAIELNSVPLDAIFSTQKVIGIPKTVIAQNNKETIQRTMMNILYSEISDALKTFVTFLTFTKRNMAIGFEQKNKLISSLLTDTIKLYSIQIPAQLTPQQTGEELTNIIKDLYRNELAE